MAPMATLAGTQAATVPEVFLVVWSGGYDAPQYGARATEDEAWALAGEWAADIKEGEDTIDVLRLDTATMAVERLEAAGKEFLVESVAIYDVGVSVDAESQAGAIEAVRAGQGTLVSERFNRYHPDTEFSAREAAGVASPAAPAATEEVRPGGYVVNAAAIYVVVERVAGPSGAAAVASVRAGEGTLVSERFDRYHPDTEFTAANHA